VSREQIGHDKKAAPRQLRGQSEEVQLRNGFAQGADIYGARAATESSRFKQKTGSEKELAHN
jgi:hypothetical protein